MEIQANVANLRRFALVRHAAQKRLAMTMVCFV